MLITWRMAILVLNRERKRLTVPADMRADAG
jgi:hypothetical protein